MHNSLVWFRNDLRVADNNSLSEALKADKVIAVYFFDPRQYAMDAFGFKKMERFRAKFLLETVAQLQENLKKLNITLLTYHAKPEDILPNLIEKHRIGSLYLQKEWTSEETKVLNLVKGRLHRNISIVETYDQFLFHPLDIPYASFQAIPNVFTQFRKKCEKMVVVRPSLPEPTAKPIENQIENPTCLPTLAELGLQTFVTDPRSAFPFKGGENEALNRLQNYFWETKKLAYYKKTRNGLVGTDYSSKFSPWLANGSISARTVYWEVNRFEKEIKKNQDTYWLIFELIWRDYFKYVSMKYGNQIFKIGGILNKEYAWGQDEKLLNPWINGNTSEAFVNANMIELRETGWMSNRGRQNVASYWAKELEQDWRIGAAYFESMLIDYDVHSNWGNWMYNSGVGNDPRDRKFNIKRQADMYDANSKFQNLWLQETLF
ncbi:DASH family cryptochrome [Flagellimonas allohymeniacidonis]|uniref:Cryptochrome DASH n=1 Tax=Flagellimonas allohymeniacidonis TaxID=2517819 RepID=A0A4Q8QBK8_9FLAO|nr:DASH family cryptochrome [Allomuricauda hymeniacidonis]TAI46777.1 DASH family cryptochrome [Allomuricauda hymeniacidonis]